MSMAYRVNQIRKYGFTNWWDRISEAKKSGSFTAQDIGAAGCWVTCACGHQDARLHHNVANVPTDARLYRLGMAFFDAVKVHDIDEAEYLLGQIEARSAELISQMVAEQVPVVIGTPTKPIQQTEEVPNG